MKDIEDVFQTYSPVVALALAVVVFAAAPLVIYLARNKEYSKRDLLVTGIQSAWILLANAMCALASVEPCIQRYGKTNGIIVTIVITAFGGTIALGLYEIVLNRRLAIGRAIEKRVVSVLTNNREENDNANS